ncbi:hypothetical protein AVEN_112662-1 [Araneus ventricosus]|uniref:Uncharacterized protein n=1 Tax=Araneus ventricosus TaxID=182803 RepID=A0A4Y2KWJ3_ARAVE|nr:hypothetical protein AVEN_112662-1 [Araneus ventricosus]
MNILIVISFATVLASVVESSTPEVTKISPYNVTTETIPTEKQEDLNVKKWKEADKAAKKFSSMLVKSIFPFAVNSLGSINLSTSCSRSLMKFLTGVKQLKLWAFRSKSFEF